MVSPKSKANVGLTLIVLFLITLISGIILHLKSHGIIMRIPAMKIIHWVAGFIFVIFTCVHGIQFKKMLNALKSKFRWFWCDTWVIIVFGTITFLTGLIKLVSPVKIHHLGLYHYWLGLIMSVAIAVHLIRGIPGWNRLRKIRK